MRCRRKNSIVTAITPHQSPTGDSFPSRGSLSGERSSPINTPSFIPTNNNFPVNRKHNERESRALWSGLLQYIALNKITGFNVTNLCACRSDGLGFQRDKPAQWFRPFDKYKKTAHRAVSDICVNNKCTQAQMGRSGKEYSPRQTPIYITTSQNNNE